MWSVAKKVNALRAPGSLSMTTFPSSSQTFAPACGSRPRRPQYRHVRVDGVLVGEEYLPLAGCLQLRPTSRYPSNVAISFGSILYLSNIALL